MNRLALIFVTLICLLFNSSSCSTASEFTLLERRQYVVGYELFDVPEGIETEEELYDYLTELHEIDACELLVAYRDKRKLLNRELKTMMESMTRSWWHLMGCKGQAVQRMESLEMEMRYQRSKYEIRRRKLRRKQNLFLRELWSNIGKFRKAYLIRHLRTTTTCHSVHHLGMRAPSCCLEVNGEYIQLPDNLQCPQDIRIYFNKIYYPREIQIREPFRKPANFSESKLRTLQMEIALDLLDIEQKFLEAEAWKCIRDRDEWAEKERIFNKLCEKREKSEKELLESDGDHRNLLEMADCDLTEELKAGREREPESSPELTSRSHGLSVIPKIVDHKFDEDPKDRINSWAEDSNSCSAEPIDEEVREQPSEIECC